MYDATIHLLNFFVQHYVYNALMGGWVGGKEKGGGYTVGTTCNTAWENKKRHQTGSVKKVMHSVRNTHSPDIKYLQSGLALS